MPLELGAPTNSTDRGSNQNPRESGNGPSLAVLDAWRNVGDLPRRVFAGVNASTTDTIWAWACSQLT